MKKERRWLKRVIKEAEELTVPMPWASGRRETLSVAPIQVLATRCA
ncbi:hypothetical protein [Brevirhabdus pacifica]|nr:hypothetical protein [Brevirhabdus pacifica]